jgi:hypothetical protein
VRRSFVVWLSISLLIPKAASATAPPFFCDSPDQYRAALAQLDEALVRKSASPKDLAASLPYECSFELQGTRMQLNNSHLRSLLEAVDEESDPDAGDEDSADIHDPQAAIDSAHAYLERKIRSFDAYTGPVDTTAPSKRDRILSQPEFRHVRADSPADKLKEALMQWLVKALTSSFNSPDQIVWGLEVVVWSVVALVVSWLVVWLWRWLKRRELNVETQREVIPFAPSAKDWRKWLEEAREARRAGDLRQAIHLGYWAAISKLESLGNWRPDRARTPREYVALLPRAGKTRAALGEVTRDFEIVWYGNRQPSARDCEEFVTKVEKI